MMVMQETMVVDAQQRVVIVDDDDLFRESLGLNLAEEGYDVVDFPSGETALDFLLGGENADAVLLDWRMPGLDGPSVLRRLRDARVQVPVIFLTMLSDEIYEEAALKWGAVDFIDKSRRLPIILGRLKIRVPSRLPLLLIQWPSKRDTARCFGAARWSFARISIAPFGVATRWI